MKTITFYSYKGGVGRSLILANVAKRLTEIGQNVCMLDFDLEAPGLEFKFWDYDSDEKEKGIVDFITSYTDDKILPHDISEYTSEIKIATRKHHGWLKLIKAGEIDDDGSYWKKLMSIDWKKLFYTPEGKGYELILHLKALIEQQIKPDYLLVDSRTGITETSGITLSILADEVVVVAANNDENIIGSELIIKNILTNANGTAPKIHFVLSRVPYTQDTKDREEEFDKIAELKLDFATDGINVDNIYLIHSDRNLEKEETLKIGETEREGQICIENDYLNFFDGVIKPQLTGTDLEIFEKIVSANIFLQEAIEIKDLEKRLKLLDASLRLDTENETAYLHRAWLYRQLKKYDKAEDDFLNQFYYSNDKSYLPYMRVLHFYTEIKSFSKLLAFVAKNPIANVVSRTQSFKTNSHRYIGHAYSMLGRDGEAFNYFRSLVDEYPDNHLYRYDLAELYLKEKDINKAEEHIDVAIKLKPNFSRGLYKKALILSIKNNHKEFFAWLNAALESDLSFVNIIKEEISTEPEFKKYYKEEAFQRILYKYNIRLKTAE